MQSGFIEALQIQIAKGLPFEKVPLAQLEAGKGIVGDCHSLGGEKQIALISAQTKQWIAQQEMKGICFSKFQENIVTNGIDYSLFTKGDILKTNHVIMEISVYLKQCFPECKRIQDKLPCELKIATVFAKVLQSGNIQVGDRIWKDS